MSFTHHLNILIEFGHQIAFIISLKEQGYNCEPCDVSCLECKGPGPHNCTMCLEQLILTVGGRCLPCCKITEQEDAADVQQECCNCTETRGKRDISSWLYFCAKRLFRCIKIIS